MAKQGMTLVELVAVVVVLGIMLGLAIPMYTRTIERSRRRTARDILQTIYEGERAYYYTQPQATRAYSTSWDDIFMDNPNVASVLVTFAIVSTAGSGASARFTARATYQRDTSKFMEINEAQQWCGGSTPGNDSACNTSSFWLIP